MGFVAGAAEAIRGFIIGAHRRAEVKHQHCGLMLIIQRQLDALPHRPGQRDHRQQPAHGESQQRPALTAARLAMEQMAEQVGIDMVTPAAGAVALVAPGHEQQ